LPAYAITTLKLEGFTSLGWQKWFVVPFNNHIDKTTKT